MGLAELVRPNAVAIVALCDESVYQWAGLGRLCLLFTMLSVRLAGEGRR